MTGTFSLQAFMEAASPVIQVISGISLFIGIVLLGLGIIVNRANPEQRSDLFTTLMWCMLGAFLIAAAGTITLLIFG